jgi:hypothetical protein
MKRSEMVCRTCINFDESGLCRFGPKPLAFGSVDAPFTITADPHQHWCAQGQWHEWSERYREMESFCWGEWEDKEEHP